MNPPCETCAFAKPGSPGAASEVWNRARGWICAQGPLPFFCHHTRSGAEIDWQKDPLAPLHVPPTERKICGGWQRAVAAISATGKFNLGHTPEDRDALRRYQRQLARHAFDVLEHYIAEADPEEKRKLRRELKDTCRALGEKV
jgi:hypothetical protein